jgi:uncharacterized protein YukE
MNVNITALCLLLALPTAWPADLQQTAKAIQEVSQKCERLESAFRERLQAQADPEAAKALETFIAQHQAAMAAEIELIGGSWKGGSGEALARRTARLHAMTAYLTSLRRLKDSLHFQDMPE